MGAKLITSSSILPVHLARLLPDVLFLIFCHTLLSLYVTQSTSSTCLVHSFYWAIVCQRHSHHDCGGLFNWLSKLLQQIVTDASSIETEQPSLASLLFRILYWMDLSTAQKTAWNVRTIFQSASVYIANKMLISRSDTYGQEVSTQIIWAHPGTGQFEKKPCHGSRILELVHVKNVITIMLTKMFLPEVGKQCHSTINNIQQLLRIK